VARAAQRRAQGVFFAFLTLFFAGIAAAAYSAEAWVIAIAAGVLTLWMAGLAIRIRGRNSVASEKPRRNQTHGEVCLCDRRRDLLSRQRHHRRQHRAKSLEAGDRAGTPSVAAALVRPDDPAIQLGLEAFERVVGRRPLLAAGNSNGDIPMLAFAAQPGRPSLSLLVLHDDPEREFDYVAGAERSLEQAQAQGWTVVSIRRDWATVFG
jgi:hypothetical protein